MALGAVAILLGLSILFSVLFPPAKEEKDQIPEENGSKPAVAKEATP